MGLQVRSEIDADGDATDGGEGGAKPRQLAFERLELARPPELGKLLAEPDERGRSKR